MVSLLDLDSSGLQCIEKYAGHLDSVRGFQIGGRHAHVQVRIRPDRSDLRVS
jgi:hypothetical protein